MSIPLLKTSRTSALDRDAIHVVAACDDGYAQHMAVMLLSLFNHCRARAVHVHVMVPQQFTEETRLREVLGVNSDRVAFRRIAEYAVDGLKTWEGVTAVTYYRLLMTEAIAPEVMRVIYLDCDLIVRADLGELWDYPLGDSLLAAVPDVNFRHRHVLGLPEEAPYFNAGMLLIDLDRWRREAIGAAALDFAVTHSERITWGDQCALNWLLRGRWLKLNKVWNVQTPSFGRVLDGEFQFYRKVPPWTKAARIIHFTAPGKPWLYMCEHPFKQEYLAYREQTPWRTQLPSDRYPHNMIRKGLRRYAPALLPAYTALRRYV